MSELASRVHESIGGVQNALYDEVVSNGWYERRPDATRSRWTQLALGALIVAVVVTAVLAAFTTFGLVGLALVVLALGLIFVGQEMPARTAEGGGAAGRAGCAAVGSAEPPDRPDAAGCGAPRDSPRCCRTRSCSAVPTAGWTPSWPPTTTSDPDSEDLPGTTGRTTGTCGTCRTR